MKRPKPLAGIKRFVTHRPPAIQEVVSEVTAGGVVFRRNEKGAVEVLLIQDAKNRWTIPKGHVEAGEEHGATAEREITEETGLRDVEAICWLGDVAFRYRRAQTLVLMKMHIWLVEAQGDTNKLFPEEWLNNIKWFPAYEAVDKIEYEDISKLMLVGLKKVREQNL
ncbi:MAG TPA: NUDIX domain-containing protein [Candidatus Binatia bacterium]|nr:NUDIX domain-containing protein [Candidatus Binatia bacterium]